VTPIGWRSAETEYGFSARVFPRPLKYDEVLQDWQLVHRDGNGLAVGAPGGFPHLDDAVALPRLLSAPRASKLV
jgi:hypothetical protein